MNNHKMKRQRNFDTKTGNREPQQKFRLGTVSNELMGGGGKPTLNLNQSIVPKKKIGKSLLKFMIPITLFEKHIFYPSAYQKIVCIT